MERTIVWFRKDLRIHDHEALYEGVKRGTVIPLFIWSPLEEEQLSKNEASLWWLHHSLVSLQQQLQKLGTTLVIRKGDNLHVLQQVLHETKAKAVFMNTRYEPTFRDSDQKICLALAKENIDVRSFHSHLLFHPDKLVTLFGEPYKVFTPFWKRSLKERVSRPLPKVKELRYLDDPIASINVSELNLLPSKDWANKFHDYWSPGEDGGIEVWDRFFKHRLERYQEGRDYPVEELVSQLSPYLAWGNLSPKAIWYAAEKHERDEQKTAFLRQLIWREFAYHQMYHFPSIAEKPLRPQFEFFPWETEEDLFLKWQKGLTGYPFVDAAMRELWETGFIHNRARMVAASFLVKHLLVPWTKGAKWFEKTLVDLDMANNAMGWQWVTGCGFDSAPYFRIFNPITQSEKFDRDGEYIRRWVPELKNLPAPYIHRPWQAPKDVLEKSGITIGFTYPMPIVDHEIARKRALASYEMIKTTKG